MKHANIEITRACNLNCSYCFNASGRRLPDELSDESWFQIIDNLWALGTKRILITGGELMMRENVTEIISYCLEKGFETSILSNGYKLHKLHDILSKLRRVQISLDSANPAIHDAFRGEGSWKTAMDAINYARKETFVEISSTISQETLKELEGIAEMAAKTSSKVLTRSLQTIGRGKGMRKPFINELRLEKERIKKKFGNIFVSDFAKYVPILGKDHDRIVAKEGFFTILPNGRLRGTNQLVA